MATVNWKFLESALQDGQLTGHPKNWQHRSVATVNYFIYLVNRRGKQGMDVAQLCNEWPSGWNDFGADFKELSSKFREISKSTVLTYGKWLYDKELIGILRTESDSYRGEKNLYIPSPKSKASIKSKPLLPHSILEQWGLTEGGLLEEIAILLYSKDRLNLEQAAELASHPPESFAGLLRDRGFRVELR